MYKEGRVADALDLSKLQYVQPLAKRYGEHFVGEFYKYVHSVGKLSPMEELIHHFRLLKFTDPKEMLWWLETQGFDCHAGEFYKGTDVSECHCIEAGIEINQESRFVLITKNYDGVYDAMEVMNE